MTITVCIKADRHGPGANERNEKDLSKLINESSIPALLEEMTVKEKIDLLTGGSAFSTLEMSKYNIPSVLYLDGATGVNMLQYVCELAGSITSISNNHQPGEKAAEATQVLESASNNESGGSMLDIMKYITAQEDIPENYPQHLKEMIYSLKKAVSQLRPDGEEPNCFPPGMLLGATWRPDLVYKVGSAVAREAIAFGVDILLGTPNTNIHRDPKNGRLFESFSEDPYLSSRMAPEFSKGVQDQGMVADVKHFAANNQETLRQGIDEHISERALREIYLPGFEAAVKEGKVGTVMSAYNSINGVPCAHNRWLLTDVLKDEWGFEGQVVSDWGAVYDQVSALNAGNDMDMPGPRGKQKLYQAAEDGTLSMERLDDAVSRTLKMILKTPKFQGKRYTTIDNALSESVAYEAAAEGITLLKNEGILPLQAGTRVALFGKLAKRFMESGSGSAQVDTSKYTSLPQELGRYTDTVLMNTFDAQTDIVIVTAGASGQEGKDRPDMRFDPEDEVMLRRTLKLAKAAGKKTLVLMNIAGPVELGGFIEDIDALVCLFFPGMAGARAAADILFGTVSPSGKLPLTFPKTYTDTPTAINFPGEYGHVVYGEGIFVGYRYYDYKNIEPLYPFGFGLSYSTFSISDVKLSASTYNSEAREPLRVFVTVKNEGKMKAKEVVQLYIKDVASTLLKPDKELKGFVKVSLEPDEEKTIELLLTPKSFASYDTDLAGWTVEPGEYELLIGNSSRNITAKLSVTMTGKNPYGCSLRSTLGYIVAHKEASRICAEVLGEAFDYGKMKGNAAYFSSTRLGTYLEQTITGIDKTSDQWKDKCRILDERLSELEFDRIKEN